MPTATDRREIMISSQRSANPVSLLKGALEKGFERLHLIAVFFAFVSDVLKPLTPLAEIFRSDSL